MIRKVTISCFRSLERVVIDCGKITTFVGKNDAGKSNILRALNLFFNNETDAGCPFRFSSDYCRSVGATKKAKEVVVEIVFDIPETYDGRKYTQVLWRKAWRKDGFHRESEIRVPLKYEGFPAHSKVPAWLDRIRFIYVPAIKDSRFFSDLQGQMYDVLSSVADTELRGSATNFEDQISEHLRELIDSISKWFEVDAEMRMPENMRQIFESLEFGMGGIPLSRRGDGIKVQHVPMILRFIADKQNSILTYGGIKYSFVWGFEEPENNIEMGACIEYLGRFLDAVRDGIQIVLTTHSPVFYGMKDHSQDVPDDSFTYLVKNSEGQSMIVHQDRLLIDTDMGLMPIVAPYIREASATVQRLQQEIIRLEEVSGNRMRLFVEGETDRLVFFKALKVFFPKIVDQVVVDAGGEDTRGGAHSAGNRALAWQLHQQHKLIPVKAAIVFDNDEEGRGQSEKLRDRLQEPRRRFVDVYVLEQARVNKQIYTKSGFNLPSDLESFFPDSLWEKAEKEGWLEPVKNLSKYLDPGKVDDVINGNCNSKSLMSGLEESEQRRVKNCFSKEGKIHVAKYIQRLKQDSAEGVLENYKKLLGTIIHHLGIKMQ